MENEWTHPVPAIPAVKLVAGVFFTLLGVVLSLDNLGLVDGSVVGRYWPLVLIAIGLLKLRDRRDRLVAFAALGVGAFLLVARVGFLHASIGQLFWPLAIIAAGAALLLRGLGWSFRSPANGVRSTTWAVLSKSGIARNAPNYAGERVVAFMGGCELDLTEATLTEAPAVLEVVATWGAIVLRVPAEWEVVDELTPIMGGVDIRTGGARGGPRLIVRGLAWMGAIEVKNGKRGMQ